MAGHDLDMLPTAVLARLMLDQNAAALASVERALPQIEAAIDAAVTRLEHGGRLHYVGAGTSGRLAALDASECPPTFGVARDMVQAHLAGGDAAFMGADEGAEDDRAAGAQALIHAAAERGDVVVGIAASGSTPYVLGAIEEARRLGCLSVGIVCVPESVLAANVDLPIVLDVGSELLQGSTRLKAGTAQKIVLNMISTAVMARLGYVYGDLMVGVQAGNIKLRARAVEIVHRLTGIDRTRAEATLERCSYDVRVAVIGARLGLSPDAARARLSAARGNLRRALEDA